MQRICTVYLIHLTVLEGFDIHLKERKVQITRNIQRSINYKHEFQCFKFFFFFGGGGGAKCVKLLTSDPL